MKILIRTLAVGALLCAFAPSASAADSHAPKGARLDWLPSDEWVMSSWTPFDEQRLDTVINTNRTELKSWFNDHRTLGQLAKQHGVKLSTRALAVKLVQPRLASVGKSMRPVLIARAEDMLTQGHLAHHVLFHVFHTPAIARHAKEIFGVSPATYRKLRNDGWSPERIGAKGGKAAAQVQTSLATVLHARDLKAVKLGAVSARQSANLWAEQSFDLAAYVDRAYRTTAQQKQFVCTLG